MVGDRLRTDNASADITWAESTVVRLARFTELDVLSPGMVREPRRTVTISLNLVPGQSASETLTLDAPGASVRFLAAGQYRVSVSGSNDADVELAVINGSAQLVSDRGQIMVAAGEKSMVSAGGAPAAPVELTASVNDASTYDYTADVAAFQRSSGGGYQSTQYLPTELYGYASVLDSYGSWQSDPTYGSVWYPRVSVDWRPYYQGQWRYYRPYGWTWIGADRWSWPTHHYGRWGMGSRGWYWIPARHWGPAWVSWAVASDYVGWCPLGWDGRPVVGYISYNTNTYRGGYTPWRGWTVMPSQRFDRHDVARYRVERDVLLRDRPSFITQGVAPRGIPRNAPDIPRAGYAIPRNGASIPGTFPTPRANDDGQLRAVPRGTPGAYRAPVDPETLRHETPYDRARRVMDRRMDSPAATTPAPTPGMSGPPPSQQQPGAYAVPRGVRSAPGWSRDDRPSGGMHGTTPHAVSPAPAAIPTPGMSSSPRNDSGVGMSGPARHSSPAGMSGPPPNAAVPRSAPAHVDPPPPPPPPPPSSSEGSSRSGNDRGNSNQGSGRRHP
jgi:hypothetical protein